ncbi:MAG: hypothetical protein R3E12_13820 [Candidatus Eisenbacteria bacterium]
MRPVLETQFIPRIMRNDRIEKWAHNASYERRFLGADSARRLECTLQRARAIAFHRLPIKRMSLAALVEHFFGEQLDKTHQSAAWERRPLSADQLAYAAGDVYWCQKLRSRIDQIDGPPAPEADSPDAIDQEFGQSKPEARQAELEDEAVRVAMKSIMIDRGIESFSKFRLSKQTRKMVPLRLLADRIEEHDPGRRFDLVLRVTKEILEALPASDAVAVRESCREKQKERCDAPRSPRWVGDKPSYDVDLSNPAGVTEEYEARLYRKKVTESVVKELVSRMMAQFKLRGIDHWGKWSLNPGTIYRHIDPRELREMVSTVPDVPVPFPKPFQLILGEDAFGSDTETITTMALRWLPNTELVGIEAVESRDWQSGEDD